jgi:16S rRNA (guanine527-N7)-methyltransferase
MTSEWSPDRLHETLSESQRLGFLGDRPIDEVVIHARGFVDALVGTTGTVLDLGSGGGVPGLVIAHDRPDLSVVLVDRRQKRTDFLRRAVMRLGWSDRVSVVEGDASAVANMSGGEFDAVVARGFGPPEITVALAHRLVRARGRVVISEPPAGDRWDERRLADIGVSRVEAGPSSVVVFVRHDDA